MTALRSFPNPSLRGWRFAGTAPSASLHYRMMRRFFQVTVSSLLKVRVFNRHHEPASGGVVYICNHQSFMDPMLMGFALRRPVNFMARDTLFHVPIFKQAIASVNAFPVRRGTADTGALKEAMRRLKSGGTVVVFAEGTRTEDGRMGEFLPGVALLSQRAADWTVPVVIEGAFDAWPRWQLLPSPGSVVVQYAPPISQADARKMGTAEFVNDVRRQMIEMQQDIRRRTGRSELHYDDE